ncbi:uncharacterized protein G2W53_027549 [Senna tora]|uniref:Uncharacterized protein n=1 Tax=Senna tora TaxID=362788 RepID=A0A834WMB8_9FABA|nr:uncharacterized protein G2W53_027549 [Senna tora]
MDQYSDGYSSPDASKSYVARYDPSTLVIASTSKNSVCLSTSLTISPQYSPNAIKNVKLSIDLRKFEWSTNCSSKKSSHSSRLLKEAEGNVAIHPVPSISSSLVHCNRRCRTKCSISSKTGDALVGELALGNLSNSVSSSQYTFCKNFLPNESMGESSGWNQHPTGVDSRLGDEDVRGLTGEYLESGSKSSYECSEEKWLAVALYSSHGGNPSSPELGVRNSVSNRPADGSQRSGQRSFRTHSSGKLGEGSSIQRGLESASPRCLHHYLSAARDSNVGLCNELQANEMGRSN